MHHGLEGACHEYNGSHNLRVGAQVQSYVSRVRFVEACAAVPADALLLEVGPHALLRSPLRQNRATLPCATRLLRFRCRSISKSSAVQAVRSSTATEGQA